MTRPENSICLEMQVLKPRGETDWTEDLRITGDLSDFSAALHDEIGARLPLMAMGFLRRATES